MVESRKPTFAWNPRAGRWEFWGKEKGAPIVTIDTANGLTVNKGSLSYASLAVGSLTESDTLNVGGVGSLANVQAASLTVAGGGAVTYLKKMGGTLPLTNVPTAGAAVATITGMTVAVGDTLYATVKATGLIAGIGIAGVHIPTTNVVVAKLVNPAIDTAGSQPAVGIDIVAIRSA